MVALVVFILASAAIAAGCTNRDNSGRASDQTTSTVPLAVEADATPPGERPAIDATAGEGRLGGSFRVAVPAEPDPLGSTLTAAAVRSLVLPQLFVADADGRWLSMLAEPGTDRTAADARSALVRLRDGAAWSDGSPITIEDLRRSADSRFVAGVDGPDSTGAITIRFTQPLPGWRRLWSGTDAIAAPSFGVWGGPFLLASRTPGLDAVLTPNPGWRGPEVAPSEVRLVLVPDATTARQLLANGEIDVLSPPADTQRSEKLGAIDGVRVAKAAADGGWWMNLRLADRLPLERRPALATTLDRRRFIDVLLDGEAVALDGLSLGARTVDGERAGGAWADVGWAADQASVDALAPLRSSTIDFVGDVDEPLGYLVHRTMTKRARLVDGRIERRVAEADRVRGWIDRGEYDVALVAEYDGPAVCWTCRWGAVDATLAAAADAGDRAASAQLEQLVADQRRDLPLWRPNAVTAWRADRLVIGRANPFGLSAAWDAWRWRTP